MRLTDAPKPLAEMKPDVAWPADVQQVMDKALSRDVTQRYQNATEFGNALYRAIDRMPETAAAEMGTQVMGAAAVPATRVGAAPVAPTAPGSSGAPSGAATVAVPTPVASDAVTHGAAPAKKKNMIPLMGGIAAVVVIGGVAAVLLRPQTKAPAAADSVKPSVTQQAQGTQGAAPAQKSPPQPTTEFAKKTPISDGKASSAADKSASVDQRLDEIMRQSKDQGKAQSLLAALDQLGLSTNEQKARAGLARYNIYLFGLGKQEEACSAIEDVEGASKGTKVEQLVSQTIRGCTG